MQLLVRRMLSMLGLLAMIGFCAVVTTSEAAPATAPAAADPVIKPFDLIVSLEWTPGTGEKLESDIIASGCGASPGKVGYVDDLIAGLRSTSEYLYGLSDGQMALRDIKIYTGGQNWANADIRVLASSATRPAAFPGGIVDTPTRYASGHGGATVFYPGTIYLGRLWDGTGSRCGRWALQAGARTIGHEWSHYALYLFDEYIDQGTSAEKYCTNIGPGVNGKGILTSDPSKTSYSVMAYQYTSGELWHPGVPDTGACTSTPQYTVHGASDWDTIERFYPVQTPQSFGTEQVFQGSDAEAMFNASVIAVAGTPLDTSALTRSAPMARAQMVGQSYLVRPVLDANQRPIPGRPLKIIGQGEIAAEGNFALPFWGTLTTLHDRAAVITQNWGNNARRSSYPTSNLNVPDLKVTTTNNVTPVLSPWQPSVSISPTLTTRRTQTSTGVEIHSEVTGITVRVNDCFQAQPPRMEFSLCPAGGTCGTPVLPPVIRGGRQWTFTFPFDGKLDPPASYGYVYIRVIGTGNETMSWYQLAGSVGPASIEGHAPLLDGVLNLDLEPRAHPPNNGDSVVMYSPAQTCIGALPVGVRGVLGTPLNIQVAVANRLIPWGGLTTDPRIRVRMSYNQELATRMEISEKDLVMMRYVGPTLGSTNGPVWRVEPTVGRSVALDWLAIGSRAFSRNGEIYAIGYK